MSRVGRLHNLSGLRQRGSVVGRWILYARGGGAHHAQIHLDVARSERIEFLFGQRWNAGGIGACGAGGLRERWRLIAAAAGRIERREQHERSREARKSSPQRREEQFHRRVFVTARENHSHAAA